MHTISRLLLSCSFVLISSLSAFSQTAPYVIYKTPVPIKIDGKEDDLAWNDAKVKKAVLTKNPLDKDSLTNRNVYFKAVWDKDYLYFYCFAQNKELWNVRTGRDVQGMFLENAFEWFLAPNIDGTGNGVDYLEIQSNIHGNLSDLVNYGRESGNWSYSIDSLKAATQVYGTVCDSTLTAPCNLDVDSGWSVELAIPFSAFKINRVLSRSDEILKHLTDGKIRDTLTVGNVGSWDALLSTIKGDETVLATRLLNEKIDASALQAIKGVTSAAGLTDVMKTQIVSALSALHNDLNLFPANSAAITMIDTVILPDSVPGYPLAEPGVSSKRTWIIDHVDTLGLDTARTGKVTPIVNITYTDTSICTAPSLAWSGYRYLADNSIFVIDSASRTATLKSQLTARDSMSIAWFNFVLLQDMFFPQSLVKNVWTSLNMLGTKQYPPEQTATQTWKANFFMVASPLDTFYRINYIWANAALIKGDFHQVNHFGLVAIHNEILAIAVTNPVVSGAGAMGFQIEPQGAKYVAVSYRLRSPAQAISLEIFSANGARVKAISTRSDAGRHRSLIDISDMPSGSYLFRLTADKQVATRRITIMN